MNKIQVIGNLGRDPEMRQTPEGQAITYFSIASNRRYKTAAGENREETDWFNVSARGRLGELCNEHLTKGRQVYLEGRLRLRTWEDSEGERKSVNEIALTDVHFLGKKAEDRDMATGDEPPLEGY